MAIKLSKPSGVKPQPTLNAPHASKSAIHKPASNGISKLLKRGHAAQEELAREEVKAEQRKAGTQYRFWLPKNTEKSITFLDGDIVDGALDFASMFEHNINMNGKWGNYFICTHELEPCPICEGGSYNSYCGLLTVIDHSEYVSKKDNSIKKDNVRLFVAKKDTLRLLENYAKKRGGLRGCRFDVTRIGDKSPAVGTAFDFQEKLNESQLVAHFGDKATPIDYDEWLAATYMPATELRKLGFGSATGPVGAEPPLSDNYEDQL